MQKSAPLTVHYGRELTIAGRDLGRRRRVDVPTRHGVIRCWVRTPPGAGPAPVYVHLHGGAFIMRHPRMDDFWARYLVARGRVAVVAVDYATAPQAAYPVAHEQVYDVLAHLSADGDRLGVDPARVSVGGFSAGGNLAAAAALLARDEGGPGLRFLHLGVPSLDLTESYAEKQPVGEPMVGRAIMELVRSTYFRDVARRAEAYASPLRADSLAGLPPTMVVTAGLDLLRREGDVFAHRLRAEGVPVRHLEVPDRDHYFLDPVNARDLMGQMSQAIVAGLASSH